MRPQLSCSRTAPLVGLLWLAFATYLAQAWGWGPYNHEWKSHRDLNSAELVYRAAHLPRSSTGNSFSANGTYTTGANTTGTMPLSTSRPSPVANASLDTSCGESAPLFNIQVSQEADGGDNATAVFNGWWLKLSGDMVLFTSRREKATGFGVDQGTRHLCVPQTGRLPRIAIVETGLDTSPLYLLDANFSKTYQPEYEPLVCGGLVGNGSQLTCGQGSRTEWFGCGLQLEIGAESGTNGTEAGQACSGVALHAFQT